MPFDTVNNCDTVAVPVTAGATEFTGKPATKADEADQRDRDPVPLVAVTFTDTNLFASATDNEYVDAVAPEIGEHAAGCVVAATAALVHLNHSYEYEAGKLPHVPFAAVSRLPTRAVPDTVGDTEFVGANNAATAAVDADHLPTEPFAFVAVTAPTMNLVASVPVNA